MWQALECGVTLLHSYEKASDYLDWIIGQRLGHSRVSQQVASVVWQISVVCQDAWPTTCCETYAPALYLLLTCFTCC